MFLLVPEHLFHVESVFIQQGTVPLQNGNDLGAILFLKKFCGMIPHVTQALNNDFLAFQVSVQFGEGNVVRISEKLLKSVLNPRPVASIRPATPPK